MDVIKLLCNINIVPLIPTPDYTIHSTIIALPRLTSVIIISSLLIIDTNDFLPLADEEFIILSTSPLNQDICFDLTINGDVIREPNEAFTVTVTVGNSNDVIVGSNTVTVTILDDNDGMKNIPFWYPKL